MKNMEMRLNDKGIVTIIATVLALTFVLGGVIGFNAKEHLTDVSPEKQRVTVEEAKRVIAMQKAVEIEGTNEEVYGHFTEIDGEVYFTVSCVGDTDVNYEVETAYQD